MSKPHVDLNELPCFLLYLGWKRARSFYRSFLESDFNPQRIYLLTYLSECGGKSLSELSAFLELDPGSCSGLVTRMQKEGLVMRKEDPLSRRKQIVCPTSHGQAYLEEVSEELAEADSIILTQLTSKDLHVLRKVVDAFKDVR